MPDERETRIWVIWTGGLVIAEGFKLTIAPTLIPQFFGLSTVFLWNVNGWLRCTRDFTQQLEIILTQLGQNEKVFQRRRTESWGSGFSSWWAVKFRTIAVAKKGCSLTTWNYSIKAVSTLLFGFQHQVKIEAFHYNCSKGLFEIEKESSQHSQRRLRSVGQISYSGSSATYKEKKNGTSGSNKFGTICWQAVNKLPKTCISYPTSTKIQQ